MTMTITYNRDIFWRQEEAIFSKIRQLDRERERHPGFSVEIHGGPSDLTLIFWQPQKLLDFPVTIIVGLNVMRGFLGHFQHFLI